MADTHQSQATSKDASDTPLYTLHYFPFSLYSLMARFSIVLGQTVSPETAPNVAIKFVDLQKSGNLTEEYLTTVNSRGQVPALTSTALPLPINESRDIANWLCEKQPDLLPADHKEEIGKLMEKLFLYHAKALNIPANGIINQAAAMLENPNITTAHRRALEIKSIFHDTLHGRTVEPDNIELVERNTREFMDALVEQLGQRSGQNHIWIFGDKPTILDGYAMPFAKRLHDLERSDLLPEAVREWALKVNDTPEWQQVSHGRSTVYKESMGPAADLKPL